MNIDFDKMQGLVPAIVQDSANRDILMLGFMNRKAFEKTLAIGYVTFYSRTRNELWTKGETSGNRLKVVSATTDCDHDSLLLQVKVEGAGVVCHEGTRSCFTKALLVADDDSDRADSQTRTPTPQSELERSR
jgi:phosphoribosyl-ATP pyrophosphohydrolase/phosphoribosyl-AMP cyclohydrolase